MRVSPASFLRPMWVFGLTLAATLLQAQGPLTPPPGPPAPTMKALDQVEPRVAVESLAGVTSECLYRIDRPGSYYLTGNITGVAAQTGIEVTTASVTIDLSGFTLSGVPGSYHGISGSGGRLTIRNGFIHNWGMQGILTDHDTATVEDITADGNGGVGIDVTGNNNAIRRCHANGNGTGGINCIGDSTVEDCQANFNTGWGIRFNNAGGRIERCTFANNTANGILQVGSGSLLIAGNTVRQNQLAGILAEAGDQILGNAIVANGAGGANGTGAGIYLDGENNHVEGNSLNNNKYGIYTGTAAGETIIRNVAIHSLTGSASNYFLNNANADFIGPIVVTSTEAGASHPMANISLP